MTYSRVLTILADPTRRSLFERLSKSDYTVGNLATLTHITQPAVSQHLRVLKDANLVTVRRDGTRHYYRANREGLIELRQYIESFWDDVLTAYAAGDPNPPEKETNKGKDK